VPVRQRAELALHTARPRPSSTSTTPAVEFRDDQLNLEVEPAARLENGLHLEALVTDEAANVLLHPLLLLAPRSMTCRRLCGAAEVSS
jgi:hypothetical protein